MYNQEHFWECIGEQGSCTDESLKGNYFFHSLIKPA